MSNLKKIQTLPLIKNAANVRIESIVETYELENLRLKAIENDKFIFAYKISYISKKHKVNGYIIEPRKGKNLPCVVYNRGGSNEFGAIEDRSVFLGRLARMAKEGYIVIASQYSGNAGGEGKDEFGGEDIHDVLNLYKILKGYARANVNKIGMLGGSRGGMMTYMALAQAKWIKAAVIEFGSTDLFDKDKHRPDFQKHLKTMFNSTPEEIKKRSALYWAEDLPKNVPLLIMHGTADWRVNPMDSLRLAEKLQRNKVPYRLIMYEGADHGITEYRKEASDEALRWLDRYVKNGEPLPNLELHGK